MAEALSIVWELIKSDYPGHAKKRSLLKMDEVLGLGLSNYKSEKVNIPDEIQKLVDKRKEFRAKNQFEEADKIRTQIEEKGFTVEDTPTGIEIKKTSN